MAGAFDAKVDISTKEATAGLTALRKEVKLTGQALQQLDGIIKANIIAQQFTKLVAEQRKAAAATKETAQADIAAARASGIRATADAKVAETLSRKANQDAQAARAAAQGAVASARVTDIEARRAMATDKAAAATRRAATAQLNMHDSMSNSRYLMYDVGATYGVLAAGLLAIPAATAAVSAAYQKDFAQVIRVNEEFQSSGKAATEMKNSLKDLATDIPVAFGELSRITQLGSQMGVANDKLAAFTETTAKFVAVTGISADTGATLFGRLETSFTADVQKFPDFFERVGSSIAYVGAQTVATDPEIASMLNQIGPLGAAAGMTAAEVTGLSAALASVRVQPELARGTLTRIFGQLNRDVAEGSPRMAEYGKILGTTGEAASDLWKTDSSKFFTDLMKGLNGVQQEQGQLTTTLDKLGIKASRDVSALTKLAVGYDVLELSMGAANKGFTDGTALSEMSAPVFETLAAKLEMMVNAWKNLGETLGGGALAPIAVLVDVAKNLAIGLDSLIDKVPAIGWVITALMGIATVTALFLGFKAAQAFVMAGMIGFQQASARGMGGGLALGGMMKTLAQTMLMAKGATDQQSRAMLAQVGASRALLIANSTTAAQIKSGTAGSFGVLATSTGRATGGIKGVGSALLGFAGGPVGIAVGALALLVGGLINAGIEAEQAGKAIAEGMAQGADAGARAIADQLANRKVSLLDGTLGFTDLDKNVQQIGQSVGIEFDKIVGAIAKGESGMKSFNAELDKYAQSKGYKNADDFIENNISADARKIAFLKNTVTEYGNKAKDATKTTETTAAALTKLGVAGADAGDDMDDTATDVDKMTDALKALNDEVFGTINAEAGLQAALASIGEGLQKSQSFSPTSEGGRENIQNVQDALTKARDYYKQLMDTNQLSAQEAAQGYADFSTGLMNEIKNQYGGDVSYVEQLAQQANAKFTAAIGGAPVSVPITYDTVQVTDTAANSWTMIQNWYNANEAKAKVGADVSGADLQLSTLMQSISEITGIPYSVVLDAMADPAHEKAREVEALLLAITNDTYVAPVDADTTAAVTNIQNFVAYARTELAHLQTQLNGGIGLGDGEGSMSPAQKAQYGQITRTVSTPKPTKAPVQVRSTALDAAKQGLDGVRQGYLDAAEAAEKAGKEGKKAAKEIVDGITDAVRAAEDFGNRLKTGMMSAYNQQYALTSATDSYHSALNAINKKREDEIKQVTDLRDRIRELNDERDKELISANKAKIEQNISLKYGEADRAADYGNQAQTSLDNAAAKQKEIDVASKEATTIQNGIGLLDGYSDAAIANREALRGLETKMIDMVAAYAAQGHSTEEVRRYAQALTGQFQTDVGQIGFNMAAVGALQGSFERYIAVIDRVPQFVATEVDADTEAAKQELVTYGEEADRATRDRTMNIDANMESFEWHVNDALARVQANLQKTLLDPVGTGSSIGGRENGSLAGGMYRGGMIPGFASGGMIPGTPPRNPRADNMTAKVDGKGLIRVRSREFIQPQEAVDYYGPDFMEAIRTMSLPKFNMGGSVGASRGGGSSSAMDSVVELGASTLAALAEMRQDIKLFTENRLIAESANDGNRQFAAEGHRK